MIGVLPERYHTESTTAPSTVINAHQTQTQSQEQQQTLVVDLALQIAEQKNQYAAGTPERTFLDDLGEALKTTKTASEVMATIFSLASKLGLGVDFLTKIFGHK